jgi:hypothetical protein
MRRETSFIRTHIGPWTSYTVLGFLGMLSAFFVSVWVSLEVGLPEHFAATIWTANLGINLAVGLADKMRQGHEDLTLYHHILASLLCCGLGGWLWAGSAWVVLDICMLQVGAGAIFGRTGCLMSGCCHGRPTHRGIVYGKGHTRIGFPRPYVRVPLVPIQLGAMLTHLAVVTATATVILLRLPAGLAFTTGLLLYATARFVLEFARGDVARPYRLGLSEAQWTSILTWSVIAGGTFSLWPVFPGVLGGTAAVLVLGTVLAVRAHRRNRNKKLQRMPPDWLSEFHGHLQRLQRYSNEEIFAADTGWGLRMSGNKVDRAGAIEWNIGLSLIDDVLSTQAAAALRRQVEIHFGFDAVWEMQTSPRVPGMVLFQCLQPTEPLPFHPVIAMPPDADALDFSSEEGMNQPRTSPYSIGRYNEKRIIYTHDLFGGVRNIHMGVDLGAPVGTVVHAFADGHVFCLGINPAEGDYGPTLITVHELEGRRLWALHGHLSHASLAGKSPGDAIEQGQVLGWLGDESENGGWPPHVHFQLSWKEPATHDLPGAVSDAEHAQALLDFPDPALVLGPMG